MRQPTDAANAASTHRLMAAHGRRRIRAQASTSTAAHPIATTDGCDVHQAVSPQPSAAAGANRTSWRSDGNQITQFRQRGLADTVDIEQIVNAREPAVLIAPGQDRLGRYGAYPGQGF